MHVLRVCNIHDHVLLIGWFHPITLNKHRFELARSGTTNIIVVENWTSEPIWGCQCTASKWKCSPDNWRLCLVACNVMAVVSDASISIWVLLIILISICFFFIACFVTRILTTRAKSQFQNRSKPHYNQAKVNRS